jgi:hypothetical protein
MVKNTFFQLFAQNDYKTFFFDEISQILAFSKKACFLFSCIILFFFVEKKKNVLKENIIMILQSLFEVGEDFSRTKF